MRKFKFFQKRVDVLQNKGDSVVRLHEDVICTYLNKTVESLD